MFYRSTRNSDVNVTSAQAIAQGISEDGGLFVPSEIPSISMEDIKKLGDMTYAERAFFVFSKFLTDYTEAEIRYCVEGAYNIKSLHTCLTVPICSNSGTDLPAHSRIWHCRYFLIC